MMKGVLNVKLKLLIVLLVKKIITFIDLRAKRLALNSAILMKTLIFVLEISMSGGLRLRVCFFFLR